MRITRSLINKAGKRIKRRLYAIIFFFKTVSHFLQLKSHSKPRFSLKLRDMQLCLFDATANTGFDRHYVFHTAWASRILAETKPDFHTDISSSLYFVANVSAFISIEFYDYRPAKLGLSGLNSHQGDLYALPFANGSIRSLSCMHVVEHIGLGRYGDQLDYDGDIKAVSEIKRVMAPGGNLLFVLPIGGESLIKFNAHRIYTYHQIVSMFSDFHLKEFSLIPDNEMDGGLIRHASETQANSQQYGCGCFWFEKEAN